MSKQVSRLANLVIIQQKLLLFSQERFIHKHSTNITPIIQHDILTFRLVFHQQEKEHARLLNISHIVEQGHVKFKVLIQLLN